MLALATARRDRISALADRNLGRSGRMSMALPCVAVTSRHPARLAHHRSPCPFRRSSGHGASPAPSPTIPAGQRPPPPPCRRSRRSVPEKPRRTWSAGRERTTSAALEFLQRRRVRRLDCCAATNVVHGPGLCLNQSALSARGAMHARPDAAARIADLFPSSPMPRAIMATERSSAAAPTVRCRARPIAADRRTRPAAGCGVAGAGREARRPCRHAGDEQRPAHGALLRHLRHGRGVQHHQSSPFARRHCLYHGSCRKTA